MRGWQNLPSEAAVTYLYLPVVRDTRACVTACTARSGVTTNRARGQNGRQASHNLLTLHTSIAETHSLPSEAMQGYMDHLYRISLMRLTRCHAGPRVTRKCQVCTSCKIMDQNDVLVFLVKHIFFNYPIIQSSYTSIGYKLSKIDDLTGLEVHNHHISNVFYMGRPLLMPSLVLVYGGSYQSLLFQEL